MTKLAAGYLNRAQIARGAKARAVREQREALSKGRETIGSNTANTLPDTAPPFPRRVYLPPAA